MDEMTLDGNAAAGLLREVFTDDMTTAIGTCGQCGASEAVGSAHVFQGAGVVMRCPHCGHALMTIVQADTRLWLGFPGAVTLEVALRTT